jgi:hypothetical protein
VAANAEVSHLPNGIKQVEYNSLYDEAYGITQKIQELLKADVPGNEIAVLYAKHAQAEVLMSQLQHAAIDYNVTRSQNVLELKLFSNSYCICTIFNWSLKNTSLETIWYSKFCILTTPKRIESRPGEIECFSEAGKQKR